MDSDRNIAIKWMHKQTILHKLPKNIYPTAVEIFDRYITIVPKSLVNFKKVVISTLLLSSLLDNNKELILTQDGIPKSTEELTALIYNIILDLDGKIIINTYYTSIQSLIFENKIRISNTEYSYLITLCELSLTFISDNQYLILLSCIYIIKYNPFVKFEISGIINEIKPEDLYNCINNILIGIRILTSGSYLTNYLQILRLIDNVSDNFKFSWKECNFSSLTQTKKNTFDEDLALDTKYLYHAHIAKTSKTMVDIYKGLNTGNLVAIKKQTLQFNNVHVNILKEIGILSTYKHKNIIEMIDFKICKSSKCYIMMELGQCSLHEFILDYRLIYKLKIKFIDQLIKGIKYLHSNKILHGDIKPDNIIIIDDVIKLTDFGMSDFIHSGKKYRSPYICTPTYRPPELLLACLTFNLSVKCGFEIDIWALGITILEMEYGIDYMIKCGKYNHFMNANFTNERAILECIISLIGSPSEIEWPKFNSLFKPKNFISTNKLHSINDTYIKNLLSKTLKYNPSHRSSIFEL